MAGTLSQLALMPPLIAFRPDDLGWSHRKAVLVTSAVLFPAARVPILGLTSGALAEIDFWAGTFGLTRFALSETSLFVWRFRPEQAWAGIHRGAQVRTPRGFRWVLTSVTPLYALVWCAVWAMPYSPAVLAVAGVPAGDVPWRWGARLLLLVLLGVVCFAVYKACRPGAAPGGDT